MFCFIVSSFSCKLCHYYHYRFYSSMNTVVTQHKAMTDKRVFKDTSLWKNILDIAMTLHPGWVGNSSAILRRGHSDRLESQLFSVICMHTPCYLPSSLTVPCSTLHGHIKGTDSKIYHVLQLYAAGKFCSQLYAV